MKVPENIATNQNRKTILIVVLVFEILLNEKRMPKNKAQVPIKAWKIIIKPSYDIEINGRNISIKE